MLCEKIIPSATMATADYKIKERLSELWHRIDSVHLSYLETDDSPEKLLQKKKLEAHILDYLYLVPHNAKFFLQETGKILLDSAISDPDFSGYKLARGWAALARYAGNLMSQPWRKEYTTIRLYSGFYKHEIEGSGLCGAATLLRVMGYKEKNEGAGSVNTFVLDGPVCPDQVAAVSRDSLIAYVECQLMIQIWEEISMRCGNCSWLDVFHCREMYAGDVEHAVSILLRTQRMNEDVYCNVKYPPNGNGHTVHMNGFSGHSNGHIMYNHNPQTTSQSINNSVYLNEPELNIPMKTNEIQGNNYIIMNDHSDHHIAHCTDTLDSNPNIYMNGMTHNGYNSNQMYGANIPQINNLNPMQNYYCNPMLGNPYIMPTGLPYIPVAHSATLPFPNGYNYSPMIHQSYCPTALTGQLIDLESNYMNDNKQHCYLNDPTGPKYPSHTSEKIKMDMSKNSKDSHKTHSSADFMKNNCTIKRDFDSDSENYENNRRNSAPRSTYISSNDHSVISLPRSDTQPSLSKAREDGTGTFESWDYVYRKLESHQDSKDFDSGNPLSPFDRDSKTLGRIGGKEYKKFHQTTLDLEDALRVMSLEKNSDEEIFRTAKINETLMKKKQEIEAKAAKANLKKIASSEREKVKFNSYDASQSSFQDYKITDKTRLISKEEAKSKKEMDKQLSSHNSSSNTENRKTRKIIVKCLSSEADKNSKKKVQDSTSTHRKDTLLHDIPATSTMHTQIHQSTNNCDAPDQGITRLVVSLDDSEVGNTNSGKSTTESIQSSKQSTNKKWECGTCTYLNSNSRPACEMCGKSKQAGAESMPLTSGGKECPKCTLVNRRQANVCEACGESLENSPTYI